MKKIVQKEDKVLRQHTKDIPISEITTLKIKKILKEMSSALKSQSDGVAIAAPQIGYKLSVFVVSGKIFHKDFVRGEKEFEKTPNKEIPKDLIFINPKISKFSTRNGPSKRSAFYRPRQRNKRRITKII